MLRESDKRTWTFDVIGRHHLDAPQKAKSKVYEENDDVDYRDLCARVVDTGCIYDNSLVVVAEM